ncbi:cell adhesion molecule Dscam2-like [Uloborus diversus]|uniref:cell adhesion molecule Dscam2-like n=1 Tax=Uloborus diversus TaxID=327109 RepID=UPI002409E3C5|nr:cell adhesion molecule Dscam2-like [Uloborus diversus]
MTNGHCDKILGERLNRRFRGPKFIHEPPEIIEFSNSTGTVITCSAQGVPEPTMRWERRDGSVVTTIPGIRQVRPDNSLVFFPIDTNKYRQDVHSTVYRCIATNKAGTIRSRDITIKTVLQTTYEAQVYDHFVIRGSTAILHCYSPPAVKPYIKVMLWLRDDGVTIGSPGTIGDKYTILPTGELIIKNVGPSDSTIGYQCQVHHRLIGESKLSVTPGKLIIREPHAPIPPTISEPRPVLIHARESEKVFLPCIGQGYPEPSYRWGRRDGDRISSFHHGDRLLHKDGILIIQHAAIQDTGVYVCELNNSVGQDKSETKLLVSAPLSAKIDPESQTLDVGKMATLSCRVMGHPVHSVLWLKNGRTLVTGGSVNLVSRDILQINPVRREDSAMYQCFVSNDQESVQGSADLFVTEDAPTFIFTFPELATHPGSSISLKCSASGNPLPQITWLVDGYSIPEAYHIRVGDYVSDERTVNSYVNITSVTVEDGGTYHCIAQNGVRMIDHAARLNIFGPPYIRPMKNITALEGQFMAVHCPVSGYPIAKVYWERDGRPLPHNHRQKTFPNGSLIIEDLQRTNDGGIYQCVAENNRSRTARRDVSLNIMAPPVVEPFFFATGLSEGKRATVTCVVASGDLPIRISWLKDGSPIPDILRGSISTVNEFTSTLSFTSVSQIHNGNYTCIASNPVASRNYTTTMLVKVPPKWKSEPSDKSVVMGQAVMFDCQAIGYPDPVIRWKKTPEGSKSQFQVIISNENVQILENGSLIIKEASKDDSGHYMCQATNDVGSGLSTVVHLKVHVAAHFKDKFKAFTLTKGQSALLNCRAIGEKPLTISWQKDRHPFNPSFEPRYAFEERIYSEGMEATIKISGATRKDSSLFTCIAQNTYGKDDTNFQIVVQEPPDRPPSVDATTKGSRSISITWSPPYSGNSLLTKYAIEYKTTKEPWSSAKQVLVDATDTVYSLQGLHPHTSYQIRVNAANAIGTGDFSDPLTVVTEGEAPSGPPREIRAIATGSKTIQVTWKPPLKEESFSPIDGYYVGYKGRTNEQYSYKTLEVSQSGLLECEITDLNQNSKYKVIVQAFNSKGAGPPSEEFLVQTLEFDPPGAPVLRLVSSTASSIHLAWELNDENRNPIAGYILFQKSESSDWEEVQLSEERISYIFYGLQCGMRYQFYLVAFNIAGRGQPSDVISARTEGTVPAAPKRESLLSTNSTFVVIHLNSWKSGGCPINFFVVQYKPLNQPEWILLSTNVLPEQRTVPITDLTPASHYMLLMTAHSDAGTIEAEYEFATLTLTGGTVPPLSSVSDNDRELFQQLKIIIPIACTTIVLVLIITVACIVLIRRRHSSSEEPQQERDISKPVDTVPMTVWEKAGRGDTRISHSREQLYFPAPYATSRISMYSADGDSEAAHHQQQLSHNTWRPEEREHTYDVPFMHRQNILVDEASHGHEGREIGYQIGRHLYLNPAVVELPPDRTLQTHDLALIREIAEAKVQSYLYTKSPRRTEASRSNKHRQRSRRVRRNIIRSEIRNETEETVYYISDAETSPSPGDSFEFSEAECDMHLRLAMEERPV